MPTTQTSASEQEHVFIGIPCYNRPEGLARTLTCLQKQSHENWSVLISDNCSPNAAVEETALAFTAKDTRITYFKQPQNLGPKENFRYVVEQAKGPFFMWASDDDYWEPSFIESNIAQLLKFDEAQLSFCTPQVVDENENELIFYEGFSRFHFTNNRGHDCQRFIKDPEILGKANLIYGIYRTSPVQSVVKNSWDLAWSNDWGADVVFLYSFISRHPITATDQKLLKKFVPPSVKIYPLRKHPKSYFIKSNRYASYLSRFKAVAPSAEFAEAAEKALRQRLRESRFYKFLSFFNVKTNR